MVTQITLPRIMQIGENASEALPHGLSNAMLLPSVTAFSMPAVTERYADCARAMARAMGVADAQDSVDAANCPLLATLEDLNEALNVPTPAQFGTERQRFYVKK